MPDESPTLDLVANVRAIFRASTPRDWDTVLTFYAPGAVWESPLEGDLEGHAALRGLWEGFAGVFQDWQLDLDEGRDLGNGVVLAVFTMRGRLVGSGGEVRERGAWIYQWVDGRIVRVLDYRDIDEARADAERLAQERG
jgi:ketosteroid isomerase-like protein